MLPQGLTGRWRYVFNLSVRSFVCYQTCKLKILKTNDAVLMPISTNGPGSKGIKRSTLEVRRSKLKVTRSRRYIWGPGGGNFLDPLSRVGFIVSNVWSTKNSPIKSAYPNCHSSVIKRSLTTSVFTRNMQLNSGKVSQ